MEERNWNINVSSSRTYYKPNIDHIHKFGRSLGEKKYYSNAYRSKTIAIIKATGLTFLWFALIFCLYFIANYIRFDNTEKALEESKGTFVVFLCGYGVWYWAKNAYDVFKV